MLETHALFIALIQEMIVEVMMLEEVLLQQQLAVYAVEGLPLEMFKEEMTITK